MSDAARNDASADVSTVNGMNREPVNHVGEIGDQPVESTGDTAAAPSTDMPEDESPCDFLFDSPSPLRSPRVRSRTPPRAPPSTLSPPTFIHTIALHCTTLR